MKLLCTGSAGFIGSNFVNMFADDHDITVIDCLTYAGNMNNLRDVRSKTKFENADIRNYKRMEELITNDFDYIVHFAAESSVDASIENPFIFEETNVRGTLNLLECARKRDINFLQISTDEVYGNTATLPPSEECDTLDPSSPYSASKASAEMYVRAYAHTYGLNTLITRTCNNYGRFQHPEKVIPKFICAALRNQPLTIYGKGESIREWIFVDDNCEAINTVLESGEYDSIYNIGTGERFSVNQIAEMILKEIPSKSEIKYVDGRPGEDMRYALDSLKMRMLGWKPKITFEEGLKKTIKWYEAMD